jgi:hypothetical protein
MMGEKLSDLFVPFSQINQAEVSSVMIDHSDGLWGVAFYGQDGKCYRWLSNGYEQFMAWLDGEIAAGRYVDGGGAKNHNGVRFYDRVVNRLTVAV